MSTDRALSILIEILQEQYRCELTGLPHGRRGELHLYNEKVFEIKEAFIGDDPEAEEFFNTYLSGLRICRQELEKLDTMVDEFCASYVGALKLTPEVGDELDTDSKKRKGEEELDSRSKRQKRVNLPKASTNLLKKWLFDHLFHPYPTEEEKSSLALQTGLSLNQLNNWFINARRRILQPMLESVRKQQEIQGIDAPIAAVPTAKSKKKHHGSQEGHDIPQQIVQPPPPLQAVNISPIVQPIQE